MLKDLAGLGNMAGFKVRLACNRRGEELSILLESGRGGVTQLPLMALTQHILLPRTLAFSFAGR